MYNKVPQIQYIQNLKTYQVTLINTEFLFRTTNFGNKYCDDVQILNIFNATELCTYF